MGLVRNHRRLNRANYKQVRRTAAEIYATSADRGLCEKMLREKLAESYGSVWLILAIRIGMALLEWWFANQTPPGRVFDDIPDEPDFSQYEVEA